MKLGKTQEEKQAAAEAKATRQELERQEADRKAFERTPAGQAKAAFDRGDHVFQYSHNVMSQEAIIVKMVGSTTSKKSADPSDILNSVCAQGWDLVNGSFVFVETGQQSRDKFMSSGQNVAVAGMTVGYYLFKRNEANRDNST